MKKGLLAFIIVVLSIVITPVYAEEFETLFKMDNELKDNTFTIQLGLREASTMAVMSNIAYNQDKLEFVSIDANEYFTVTKSKDINNGSFKSFKILADSINPEIGYKHNLKGFVISSCILWYVPGIDIAFFI